MQPTEIRYATMEGLDADGGILQGEIKGERTYLIKLAAGESRTLSASADAARIFTVSYGEVDIAGLYCDGRALVALAPGGEQILTAKSETLIFLIEHTLTAEEIKTLDGVLPYRLNYDDATRYREACKSEKTVSRYLLKERIIPRIAIGSVETYGDDRIANHEHPYVDQLFFSFSENDMQVVIDDTSLPMKGDTLLHIPVASSHGVAVSGEGCAHYVWVDFIIDEEKGLEFLETAHIEI